MKRFVTDYLMNVSEESTIIRRGTFWNLVSSVLNSAMTAIIMFFVGLTNDVSVNGWFSIATAVAYQCQSVGFFGVRNLHIADTNKDYSFSDYTYFNVLSSVLMICILSYLSFGQGYTLEKALLVFIYGIYRALDIYEALFHDEYQRDGRLDIGTFLQTIRFMTSLVVMILVLLIFKNLLLATLVSTIFSAVIIYSQNKLFAAKFSCTLKRLDSNRIKKLFVICLPIFISGFINMYLANAAKYSIDNNLNDELQGIYGILSLPIFTINLLSTVVYKPYISQMAEAWYQRKFQVFRKIVFRQIAIITFFTISISLFGYFLGLTLLEILYNVDLHNYVFVFILLLIGGGINTTGAFLNFIIVIFREQNKNMLIYITSGLITILVGNALVVKYNLLGAALIYILSSSVIVMISTIVLWIKYERVKNLEYE